MQHIINDDIPILSDGNGEFFTVISYDQVDVVSDTEK